jgi:hypothetical protein
VVVAALHADHALLLGNPLLAVVLVLRWRGSGYCLRSSTLPPDLPAGAVVSSQSAKDSLSMETV